MHFRLPLPSTPARVFIQSITMTGHVGPYAPADGLRSYGCIGISVTTDAPALLCAVDDLRTRAAWFELKHTATGWEVLGWAEAPGTAPDAPLPATDVQVTRGPDLWPLLAAYGTRSGRAMQGRVRATPLIGWCSWYHYYGRDTEQDILANAAALRRDGTLPPGAALQIDDGWNHLPGQPRNWGDWLPGPKFPRGMKAVADDLRALGLVPGLWLAPFSCDVATDLARAHPEWLLGQPTSAQLLEGPQKVRGLDLTHPGVLAFLEETFDRVCNHWGYDYLKLDFLMHGLGTGTRHDMSITPSAALHRALQLIRRVMGEQRYLLCCGAPLGPCVGVADGMRVGFDVGARWHAPMLPAEWPYGNCSVKPAAVPTLHRQWMNGRWWQNDPDCLMARDRANAYDPQEFGPKHLGGAIPPKQFGLTDEEAGLWARVALVTDAFYLLSEVMTELALPRAALLRQTLAAAQRPSAPRFDTLAAPDCEHVVMGNATGDLAVFNLADSPWSAPLHTASPGTRYREELTGEIYTAPADGVLPALAPHSARLWRRA